MMDGLYRDLALESLEFGRDADPETGLIVNDPECAVNLLPIPVRKSSRVRPASEGIFIRVLFYRPEIPPELIHTYCYQPEANWSTYCAELSDREWTTGERRLTEDGFIRVAVKPAESGKGCGDCFSIEEPLAADAPAAILSGASGRPGGKGICVCCFFPTPITLAAASGRTPCDPFAWPLKGCIRTD